MTTDLPAGTASAAVPHGRRRPPRRSWRRALLEAVAVLVVFAVAGAAVGWAWFRLWDPPLGAVQDGEWLYLDFPAVESEFSATAIYVVLGALVGLLLGVVAAVSCRASELVTLVAVTAGSALAAYLAHRTGLGLSAPDPTVLAATAPEGTELPGRIEVGGRSPFVAWPVGALIGLATTYFLTGSVSAGRDAARPFDDEPRRPTHRG